MSAFDPRRGARARSARARAPKTHPHSNFLLTRETETGRGRPAAAAAAAAARAAARSHAHPTLRLPPQAAESGSKPPPFAPNPLLQGRSPSSHVLAALSAVRRPDLEQALLLLPYPSAAALLSSLPGLLAPGDGARAELAAAAAVLLLRLHSAALGAAPATRPALLRLRALLRARLGEAAGECRLIVAGGEAVARMVAGAGGGGGGAAGDDEA